MCRIQVQRHLRAKKLRQEQKQQREIQQTTLDLLEKADLLNEQKAVECFGSVFLPQWGCGPEEETFPCSVIAPIADTLSSASDDSESSSDDSSNDFAEKHFEEAFNQGFFNTNQDDSRKERQQSYKRKEHRHSKRAHKHRHYRHSKSSDTSLNELTVEREEGVVVDSIIQTGEVETTHHHRHKSHSTKLRRALSCGGIKFHDINEDMSIDAVYELQSKFFSSFTINDDSSVLART